jgi:lambda family phage portal protein
MALIKRNKRWSGTVVPLRPSANTGWNTTGSTYEGASLGRRTIGWNPGNESVNSALFRASDTLRARSRDMIRKNAWANNGSEVFVSEAIGTGIKPQSQHTDAATKEALQKLWTKWTDYCDAHGTSDFYGLQALAVRSMMEGGECFIRLRYRKASDGLDIPLQLQLLESEHCPSTLNRTEDNGNVTKYGIEFDQIGRRVAYWMYPEHPGEYPITGNPNLVPVRVPAAQILHMFRPLRPGQVRGEPWLSRALIRLYDYDQYTDADLAGKKIAALFAGFITELDPADPAMPNQTQALPGEADYLPPPTPGISFSGLEPGTMQKLRPGEDIKFATPPGAGSGFKEFNTACLREIAAAIGVTYEQLTGDLTGVNYSSIRAGLLTFRRRIEQLQHAVIVFQLCRPVWEEWLKSAVFANQIKARKFNNERDQYLDVKWITQGWQWVDPQKELDAAKESVRCGFTSVTQVISERGYDVEDTFADIAREQALADKLGLVLDTDARQTANNGQRPNRNNANPDGIVDDPGQPGSAVIQ